jgi:HPt (histidine-containing phosphotransfer) domain-containing protein
MSEPPIDLTHLGLYTAGDTALERELIALFLSNAAGYLARLTAAADGQAWHDAAHGLRGSALGVGAAKVAALAAVAERQGPGTAGRAMLIPLEDALDEVRAFADSRK